MNLSQGRTYLAIPGPSVVPDRVLNAMHRASPNIYEGEIHEITATILTNLRRLANTTSHVYFYFFFVIG
jgi:alanine-glyoxylate transaminase/serine-glyoxylate transaminase/serine-pyruvate transaminase